MDEQAARALADELRRRAEAQRFELVQSVLSLAAVDAPSGAGADALRPAADILVAQLAGLGGELSRTPGPHGELIELAIGPRDAGAPVAILAHYDTVWPPGTAARRPASVTDTAIHGPGVFDMRGGIAAAIGALRLLGPGRLAHPTVLLATPDEETGSASSVARIRELGDSAACVLVLEPPLPGGGLKTARAGWATYRISVAGRAAHAGLEPERGVSAIDELCDLLVSARRVAAPDLGTTLNVGVVDGGTLPNIVAADAHAVLDVRARQASEQQRVDRFLHALTPGRRGASVEITRTHVRPPLERSAETGAAFAHARELATLLGVTLTEGAAGGVSDANLLADQRVPVLDGLGPDGGGAHAEHEHIVIDSLVQRAALLAMLLAFPPGAAVPVVAGRSRRRPEARGRRR